MTDHAVFVTTRRVLLVVVVANQLARTLPTIVTYQHDGAWAAYGLLTAVLALVAGSVAAGQVELPAAIAVPGAAVVLAASFIATTALPGGASFSPGDWAFGLAGWYLLLVLIERPMTLVAALAANVGLAVANFAQSTLRYATRAIRWLKFLQNRDRRAHDGRTLQSPRQDRSPSHATH